MTPALYRVILPVSNIEQAADIYGRLFKQPGRRVSPGRHYFDCGSVILACYDPVADGDDKPFRPNPEEIYFAVEDLDTFTAHAASVLGQISKPERMPWGEYISYTRDPFGSPLAFVQHDAVFTG